MALAEARVLRFKLTQLGGRSLGGLFSGGSQKPEYSYQMWRAKVICMSGTRRCYNELDEMLGAEVDDSSCGFCVLCCLSNKMTKLESY